MPLYAYECPGCGSFEMQIPMSEVSQALACPDCGRRARKLVTVPNLARTPRSLDQLRQREEASREAPDVVDVVPRAARRSPSRVMNPKWTSLPRP